jgi:hypothetical protein
VGTKVAVAAMIVSLAGATSGCKKLLALKKSDAGAASGAAADPKVSAADLADEQLQEKLDEYIKCLNSLSSSIRSSRKEYVSSFPKTGPTGRESSAYIAKLPDGAAAQCSAGVAKAKLMPPKNPQLEQAGDEFAKYAAELDPQITTLNEYFEKKNFRDDKWAKGKQMHAPLMASFHAFNKADNQLHTVLDGITKPLAQRTLARIERDQGRKFAYHRKHVLNTARDVVEAADPGGEEDAVDFGLYTSTHNELEAAVKDLETYGAAHKAELDDQKKAPHWPVADSNYDSFLRAANDYVKASKNFFRCLRDAPAKAKTADQKVNVTKIPKCPDARPLAQQDAVVNKYNEFIRTSNRSQFP